ncbi:MAG: pyridoxal-phosphate dependent enzyme [Planctomycetota bacterium]|jgi:D-cysteine desulfhydrase
MEGLFDSVPRVDLSVRPTPVEVHRIAGREVLVKHDDRIGGNKARTLEFVMAGGPKRVITFSSLSAHHALATERAADCLGIDSLCVIVRRGRRGPALGQLHRFVEVRTVVGAAFAALRNWSPGTRVIPPGGMSARGALGFLAAAQELEEIPERIYVPLGTGTTVSGLLAGLMLRGATTEVVGVRVADAVAGWPWLLWRRARKALALLGRKAERGGVTLRIVKAGGAYGEPTPAALAAAEAASELHLEATYTGKTMAVLLAEDCERPLFWQTYAAY